MKIDDAKRISDHFRRSLKTYENGALVQAEASDHLIDLISKIPSLSCNRVLEIGCCTGKLTEEFCLKHEVDTLYANDLVEEFCLCTSDRVKRLVNEVLLIKGDIESATLPENLDLILSSSTFQWLTDFKEMSRKMALALSDSGYLAFSLFGPGTMCQIKELIGVSLDYMSFEDVENCLVDDFEIQSLEVSHKTIYFKSPRAVLRHIQQTGVGGVDEFRWTPGKLKQFERQYKELFFSDDGYPLDYASIFVVAQKKGENQI